MQEMEQHAAITTVIYSFQCKGKNVWSSPYCKFEISSYTYILHLLKFDYELGLITCTFERNFCTFLIKIEFKFFANGAQMFQSRIDI